MPHVHIKSDVLQDIIWGTQHDAFTGELEARAVDAWMLGARDDVTDGIIRQRVAQLQLQDAFGALNPFRVARLREGELLLGSDQNPIRRPAQSLTSGLQIAAGSGAGKTNLLYSLICELAALDCSIWVSEMAKRQLRHLRPTLRGRDLVILRPEFWRFNLLQVTSGDPHLHAALVVRTLQRCLDQPLRATMILRRAIYELYQRRGVFTGEEKNFPCLFDLYEWLRTTPGLNVSARDALVDRLAALLIATRSAFAYRCGWSPIDLARFSIVFEMAGAPEFAKHLLMEWLLHSIFHYEVTHGIPNAPLRLAIAFEDCQGFLASDEPSGELPGMDELAGIVRGAGLSLIAIFQTLQGVSRRLCANLATKIFGRLGTHEDYATAGADMGLTPEQIQWAKRNLKPGMFVGQVNDGDWREPFLFRVPLLNVPPLVTEAEVAASIRALAALPVIPATEFQHWTPVPQVMIVPKTPAPPLQQLSDVELRFLEAVLNNPGAASSTYARTAGLSGQRAAEVRARLVTAGLIREHAVATSARGRTAIVLEPLEAARVIIVARSQHPT